MTSYQKFCKPESKKWHIYKAKRKKNCQLRILHPVKKTPKMKVKWINFYINKNWEIILSKDLHYKKCWKKYSRGKFQSTGRNTQQ